MHRQFLASRYNTVVIVVLMVSMTHACLSVADEAPGAILSVVCMYMYMSVNQKFCIIIF